MVVVLVIGVPGSGKSTLARALAPILRLPVLSKDLVKEVLGGALDPIDRARLSRAASELIWNLAGDQACGAVIDIWLDPRRDVGIAQDGLHRVGIGAVAEIIL